ncbi:MAG: sigma-70 family RNA polymerase sigma factor [Candidatus Aquilonibacter sp.]
MVNASELMERVRARDSDAFETLYDAYHRLVYSVALRVLNDTASAEDVTQAVFLKLWSSPESFREGNFSGWLVRVARNRALDLVRTRAAHPQVELPESMPEQDALEDTAFAHLNGESVRRALGQLSESERMLITLGFFGGLTHQELARRTDTPLGTVKTRIRAALRKLRAALDGVVAV